MSAPGKGGHRRRRPPLLLLAPALLAAAFLLLPLVGLVLRAGQADLVEELGAPVVRRALLLSLLTASLATLVCLVLGVPLAWLLARVEFPGRRVLRGLVTVPLVLPPVVGGVALLLVLGRRGLVGRWLESTLGIALPFSTAGVVVAEAFVAMPFLVLSVEGALRSADRRLEDIAATLGARPLTTFRRVTLPLVAPAVAAGAVLCWARALGEFGATITFAGSLPGRTQTLPLAVYGVLEAGEVEAAVALSLVLLAVSVLVLVALREAWLPKGRL